MITVVKIPDPGGYDAFDDGLVLPIPVAGKNSIVLEPRDGDNVMRVQAEGFFMYVNDKQVGMGESTTDVYITDARVAVACSKYKVIVAARRHGKMLVGQTRYPWLKSVGSTTRFSRKSVERLVLRAAGTQGEMKLTLQFSSSVDAAGLAAEIARRAARYRMSSEPDLESAVMSKLRMLSESARIEQKGGKENTVASFVMPSPHRISALSGALMPGGSRPAPAPVPLAVEEPASDEVVDRFCWKCGAERVPGERQCGQCGTDLQVDA